MTRYAVLTLFPAMVEGLMHSVIKRAADAGIIHVSAVDIRDFADNKHRQADDYPYGGGCGMVMKPEPVFGAYTRAKLDMESHGIAPRALYMTPRGKPFTQATARELSRERGLIILCGHYEGVDERAIELINPDEISLGDFVMTGGELAAMAVIDAVARLVPGVLSNEESTKDESFSAGLLEYPQYTRPPVFMGLGVPPELLSGHHANVALWRRERAVEATMERRPDLLKKDIPGGELVFVRPVAAMREAAMAFRDEFIRADSKMNGAANLLKYDDYGAWLAEIGRIERGEKEGRLASTVLFAVLRETGVIAGIADIRHRLVPGRDHLPSYVNGHLGGSIRPSMRGRGLAKQMLRMSVAAAAAFGNSRVYVSCDGWNAASEHVIRSCGGVFINEVTEQNGNIIKRFWIDTVNE